MGDLPRGNLLDGPEKSINDQSFADGRQGKAEPTVGCIGEGISGKSVVNARRRKRIRMTEQAWRVIRSTSSKNVRVRRAMRMVLVVLVLVATTATGLVWHHKAGPKHLVTVTPGILYRSGFLRPHNLRKVLDEYGIRTVVNLYITNSVETRKRVSWEARICREMDVRFVDIPMVPKTPPTPDQVAHWLTLLEDEKNLPILVHCEYGVDRTGMMVAVYEMEFLNRGNLRALADMPPFGHDLQKATRKPVRDFILNYEPRRSRKP